MRRAAYSDLRWTREAPPLLREWALRATDRLLSPASVTDQYRQLKDGLVAVGSSIFGGPAGPAVTGLQDAAAATHATLRILPASSGPIVGCRTCPPRRRSS